MILFINTADQKEIFIGVINKNNFIIKKKFQAQYQQAEKLLVEIDRILAKSGLKLNDLKAIAVVNGPGPFTALRVGVSTANTLAYALNIRIVGIELGEFNNLDQLTMIINQKIIKAKLKVIIKPFYGKEPNITRKK